MQVWNHPCNSLIFLFFPIIQPRDHRNDVTKWCCCTTSNMDFAHMKHRNMVVWKYWWHSLGTSHGCTSGKSAGAPCLRPDYIWPFCRAERIFPTYRAQYEESCLFLSFSTISPFLKYLYPAAGLLSQLVQGQLIKREKSSVRLSSCTAKSSVYCFNITNDKLGVTDLHCLHNDWIFTTNFIRWVMTDTEHSLDMP